MTAEPDLPSVLGTIREDFLAMGPRDRLQLLLEFAEELPDLPERYQSNRDALERVEECQSPVFITVEVTEGHVFMFATAPAEAPTTRGFASILVQGLSGLTVVEVLAIPADFPLTLGLNEAVSPLRIRGMAGMLRRVQRRVSTLQAALNVVESDASPSTD